MKFSIDADGNTSRRTAISESLLKFLKWIFTQIGIAVQAEKQVSFGLVSDLFLC